MSTTEQPEIDDANPTPTTSEQLAVAGAGDEADMCDGGQGWRSKPEQQWTSFDRSEAYLDTRPVGGHFDPALDYGHPDWREPESDIEAAARLAHLEAERAARPPQAPELRERTPVEDALLDASIEADLADRAHDPALWTHYRELAALDRLEPLHVEEIAERLGEHEHEHEHDEHDEHDEDERDGYDEEEL